MLGNDIVDLADPESSCGGQHPRFDRRVFSRCERAALSQSPDPTRARWVLWAVKESAFKGLRRARPDTVFSPVRFVVDLDSQLRGSVTYRDTRYSATVEMDRDCVHAIVSDDSAPAGTLWGSRRITDDSIASQQVRALALDRIADRLGIDRSDLSIDRVGRIPHLVHRGERTMATLSLSHHGSYVGFACRLAPWSVATADLPSPRLQQSLERATH
ncbi:MAG: 4'-phosphopantetheinyl transferase superfamily protein [Myxococcota bacterium]